MLRGSMNGEMSMKSPNAACIPFAMPNTASAPITTPTSPASSAYPAPSEMNCWISNRRCAPTARSMPISDRRSAASMVKISTISSTPTAMENRPKTMKNVTKMFASSSASSTKFCLIVLMPRSTSASWGCSNSTTAPVRSSPDRSSPVLEIPMALSRPSWPVNACNLESCIVIAGMPWLSRLPVMTESSAMAPTWTVTGSLLIARTRKSPTAALRSVAPDSLNSTLASTSESMKAAKSTGFPLRSFVPSSSL